jgi:hypothetical protein
MLKGDGWEKLAMASVAFAPVAKLIELLSATAGNAEYVRVLGPNRLGLGADPFRPTHIIDIAMEALVPCCQDDPDTTLSPREPDGV